MCSVNIFHLNKRLGQPATLLSNSIAQAANQKHSTLKTFIGVSFWHVRESASHAMNVTSSQFPLVLFAVNRRDSLAFKTHNTGKNTHQSSISLFADDKQSILLDCLFGVWQNISYVCVDSA